MYLSWVICRKGASSIEAALLFPVLFVMLFGFFDIGNALLVRQKIITASQVAGDLVARERSVTTPELEQAIEAARLAIEPFNVIDFGIDIVGVRFDADDDPEAIWRETSGNIVINNTAVDRAVGLGVFNEGVVVVTTQYRYVPPFTSSVFSSDSILSEYIFREVSYFRGRRNSFVPRL